MLDRLKTNPASYEKQALAHVETLENAYDCYFAAVELHAAFPGKHRAVIAELLRKAMVGRSRFDGRPRACRIGSKTTTA